MLPQTSSHPPHMPMTSMDGVMSMGTTFDQTFNNIPQDLWKMPMTLEWDWADMTGTGGFTGGYEEGISMNGVLPDFGGDGGAHGTSGFNAGAMNGGQ